MSVEDRVSGIDRKPSREKNLPGDGGVMSEVAVLYQLDKVDQGGAVQDLFEEKVAVLAEALGWEVSWSGELILPDGRWAGLSFESYIRKPSAEELAEQEAFEQEEA